MHKVGRNDPCPCGSGKKYKKCCEMPEKPKRFYTEVMPSTPEQTSPGTSRVSSLFFKSAIPPASDKPVQPIVAGHGATLGS